jgi:hypothetical protein
MRELLFRKAARDDSSTASSSSTSSRDMDSDDTPQPMKPIRSYSDSAKLNTTGPSVFEGRRPHRRSGILRTRSAELVNEIKSPRAAGSIKFNKRMIGKFLEMVSSTNHEIESTQQGSVQNRSRVQGQAAEVGRAKEEAAVQENHERRAATILQAIARGYLIRKQQQNKKEETLFLRKKVSPFTSPVQNFPRRRYFPRQCSEITMSDFSGSARSLASCCLSTDQISVLTTPTGCTRHFAVWTKEDPTLDEGGSMGMSEVDEDEDEYIMSQTLHDPPSTDEPSWNPIRQPKIPKGDAHPRSNNYCFNDSFQDTPAMPPSRKQFLVGKNNSREHPAPPLAPVRAPSLPTINLDEDDEDEEEDEDEASLCSIPPLKPIREGQYSSSFQQSSFSSVFGASQDSDFPLARPSRTLSPLVSSPASRISNDSGSMGASPATLVSFGSIGSCSFMKLSASMAEL